MTKILWRFLLYLLAGSVLGTLVGRRGPGVDAWIDLDQIWTQVRIDFGWLLCRCLVDFGVFPDVKFGIFLDSSFKNHENLEICLGNGMGSALTGFDNPIELQL